MDIFEDIAPWFFGLWFITFPLSIWITYTIITELLDLIINTGRINNMLGHSDNLNIHPMREEFERQKVNQSNLNSSNLNDAKRQIEYTKLLETRSSWRYHSKSIDQEKIIAAKKLSDILRID